MDFRKPRPGHKEYGPLLYFTVIAGLTLLSWAVWTIVVLVRTAHP